MPIVGFGFTKIIVQKDSAVEGKVAINNTITIKNIEKADLMLGKTQQDGLKFTFEFASEYEPKIGTIELTGDILFIDEEKKIKTIMATWKKDKKVDREVSNYILNNVLSKCNIQALILSQEIGLPAPIPLPRLEPVDKPESE